MKTIRLLLIGFGNVGQGLAELLLEKNAALRAERGLDIRVVGIGDMLKGSVYRAGGIDLKRAFDRAQSGGKLDGLPEAFAGDAPALIAQAEADVMVEATYTDIKTGEPATTHIRTALERGLHVTTTNKGPLALHYRALAEAARQRGLEFLYEGTVMSGTPVLNLIRETLAGSTITAMEGILNGTTNYILTEMEKGQPYEAVLARAQELGYAEAVPDADVLGWDVLAKVTILANCVFGAEARPDRFPCEGITGITAAQIAAAKAAGRRFKLIGRVWREGADVHAEVKPIELDLSHPLAGVSGATNAVKITTDTLGAVTVVGPGAGRRETGYSALVDIIRIGGVL